MGEHGNGGIVEWRSGRMAKWRLRSRSSSNLPFSHSSSRGASSSRNSAHFSMRLGLTPSSLDTSWKVTFPFFLTSSISLSTPVSIREFIVPVFYFAVYIFLVNVYLKKDGYLFFLEISSFSTRENGVSLVRIVTPPLPTVIG